MVASVLDQLNGEWRPYPKLSRYKNRALIADPFSDPARIELRHKTGINVLYSNGAAKWVDIKAGMGFDPQPNKSIADIIDEIPPPPNNFSVVHNQRMWDIWLKLDAQ
jgi:hypothetical protein